MFDLLLFIVTFLSRCNGSGCYFTLRVSFYSGLSPFIYGNFTSVFCERGDGIIIIFLLISNISLDLWDLFCYYRDYELFLLLFYIVMLFFLFSYVFLESIWSLLLVEILKGGFPRNYNDSPTYISILTHLSSLCSRSSSIFDMKDVCIWISLISF